MEWSATPQSVDAATKVYLSCVDRAAKHLDDHRSDPATIAQGALSVCGSACQSVRHVTPEISLISFETVDAAAIGAHDRAARNPLAFAAVAVANLTIGRRQRIG